MSTETSTDLTTDWIFTRSVTRKMFEEDISVGDVLDVIEQPTDKMHQQDDDSDDIYVYVGDGLAVICNDAERVVITILLRGSR